MTSKGKLYWAKVGVVLGAIPLVLWAYETGPDAGVCGVPNERGTCAQSGCHTGVTNDPANKGSVSVNFPNGLTYLPGVVQHLSVTVADPAVTQTAWGFQLTARTAANSGTQAGTFASSDSYTALQCAQVGNVFNESSVLSLPTAQTCPSNMGLQYIEHNDAGYLHTLGQQGSATYQFNWTPPATSVGNVVIYVAGNAGAGGEPNTNGHIYSTSYTLTPEAVVTPPPTPVITPGLIANGASYQAGIVPNSWMQIQGTNLSSVVDTWANSIVNGVLPTKLDNVSVTVGGQPAYVYYVSPTQINVLAPNVGVGPMAVTVTNGTSASLPVKTTSSTYGPAFFTWPGNQAVATRTDYSLAVKNGTFSATTVAAKPGDVIVLWGTGFGPTTPAAPVGVATPPNSYVTASPVAVTLGGTPVSVYGNTAALAAGAAGLYQLAITVPANMANGDYPIIATIQGVPSPSTILTVQQ